MITGKNISDAFELVVRCGQEVNGLKALLIDLLSQELQEYQSRLGCVPTGDVIDDYCMDEGDVVQLGWIYAVALKAKGRGNQRAEMHLGFQISMTGDGCAIPGNHGPLLHVFCWKGCPGFEDNFIAFPLDDDEVGPQVIENRLLVWETSQSKEWSQRAWTYSLQLVQLNSPDDLRVHVTRPAVGLLLGKSAVQALPDTLPALVRYPVVEKLLMP